MTDVLRIANCSGFYGDRLAAAREMVEGGPIDVLTGDYLAELTMMILYKSRQRDATQGYAWTFLQQFEEIAATCKERGIRIVVNAGGLNPAGCAEAARTIYRDLGVQASVAHIEGDDLMPHMDELRAAGERFVHLDKGIPLEGLEGPILSSNIYLGGYGIAAALEEGADLVICPRITDAALVVGPAVWRFGWARDDWDRLASAVVAGHIIECGPQCTGGNYAFFDEVEGLEYPGFPIAEMHEDGRFVVTKHVGTGGQVSRGTVTAQLLYEIGGFEYFNPDATARFDSIEVEEEGPDRVRVSGVKGEPPPPHSKVCINYLGGFRNSVTFVLCGLNVEAKAQLVEDALWKAVGGRDQFAETHVSLRASNKDDPGTNEEAFAYLTLAVKDADAKRVGRAFSSKAVELVLASYPGLHMTSPPTSEQQFGVYWPARVDTSVVHQQVVLEDGRRLDIEMPTRPSDFEPLPIEAGSSGTTAGGRTEVKPLGTIFGARSGDKGGNANLGVWARSDAAYRWLESVMTIERLKALLPETQSLEVQRYAFPKLRALNFVVVGMLGDGVAASLRSDPQGKSLGEYWRAKCVPIPVELL